MPALLWQTVLMRVDQSRAVKSARQGQWPPEGRQLWQANPKRTALPSFLHAHLPRFPHIRLNSHNSFHFDPETRSCASPFASANISVWAAILNTDSTKLLAHFTRLSRRSLGDTWLRR